MAYDSTIPNATDQISLSQGDIQANFTALGAIAGNGNANSSSLDSNAGLKWILLTPQTSPPAGTVFPANSIALFSNVFTTGTGNNELNVNHKDYWSATTVATPMTAYVNNNAGITNGWTYLPSGLKIAWGFGVTGGGGTLAVLYSASLTNFPGFSTFWTSPQLTLNVSGTCWATIPTATGFTANTATPAQTFYWMTLGL